MTSGTGVAPSAVERAEAWGVIDERTARIGWARLAEPADPVAHSLVARHGALGAIHWLLGSHGTQAELFPELKQPVSAQARYAARLRDLDVARELEVTATLGARVVVPGDEEWPAGLDDLERPPFCLWLLGPGDLGRLSTRSVAVVGARAATAYGNHLAAELAGGLAGRGFTIVSGAAYGIDAAAHRAALAVQGSTVAVLAGGIDRFYPVANSDLIAEIARTGVVASESPPGSAPLRPRFLTRNRVIAALACGTLVVEAGLRSGARATAGRAAELNRPVAALPGPVTSMVSAGCHELIRDGLAVLVTDAAEVAELVGPMGEELAPPRRGQERATDQLAEPARLIWSAMTPGRSFTLDRLCAVAGLAPAEVRSALGELLAVEQVQRTSGGWARTSAGVGR